MQLCKPEECTGCFACFNSCTHNALNFVQDEKGFYAPLINEQICTECGLCEKKCPVLHPVVKNGIDQYGFACWSNNPITRKESSSGGFFTEAAKSVLAKDGVVAGAAFDKKFIVRHEIIDNETDLLKLRGSKYVQSHIGNVYKEIKTILKDRIVLFTGTPCQIAGLYGYLGKDYENLYTIDLICHGVPSPQTFEDYKKYILGKYEINKINNINFRCKKTSWSSFCMSIRYTGKISDRGSFKKKKLIKEYLGKWHKDPFLRLFLRDYILHESCYDCKYTCMNRMGDITMADFWGFIATSKEERNTDEGISLALINTGTGEKLFEMCKLNLIYFRRDADMISKSQKSLSSAWDKPKQYDEFWKDYENLSFEQVIEKYGYYEKLNLEQWIGAEFLNNRIKITIIRIVRLIKKTVKYISQWK